MPAIIDSEARMLSLFHDLEVRFLANQDAEPVLRAAQRLHRCRRPARARRRRAPAARPRRASRSSTNAMAPGVSSCFTANGGGTLAKAAGWDGSASAASWRSSTGCCAARRTRASSCGRATCRSCARSSYVITLDSDTQLPMDTARRLVGTLSHPLNRPRFDARLQRVTEGYGVLQPRVGVSLESASRTSFALVFSGHVGIDPYTSAVSDVYQDIFHEGSFVGKGIYDVDAFTAGARRTRTRKHAPQPRPLRRASTPEPDSAPTSTSWTTTRRTTWRLPRGCTGGFEATGRSCAGCGGPSRT